MEALGVTASARARVIARVAWISGRGRDGLSPGSAGRCRRDGVFVVPGEEGGAERAGVLEGAETGREVGVVLEGLALRCRS
jgi:hypothetical protein